MREGASSAAAYKAIKRDCTVDFCQADTDVLCCPREWTLIGWDGRWRKSVCLYFFTHAYIIQKSQRGMEEERGGTPGSLSAHWPRQRQWFCDIASCFTSHFFATLHQRGVIRSAVHSFAMLLPSKHFSSTTTLQPTTALICNSWLSVVWSSGPQPFFCTTTPGLM